MRDRECERLIALGCEPPTPEQAEFHVDDSLHEGSVPGVGTFFLCSPPQGLARVAQAATNLEPLRDALGAVRRRQVLLARSVELVQARATRNARLASA